MCQVEGCYNKILSRGLCSKHYQRIWKSGSFQRKIAERGAPLDWLLTVALTHKEPIRCLIWPYQRDSKGYARINHKSKNKVASRLVCIKVKGKPPTPKHEACHSCGNGHPGCVNPYHLRWGTRKENSVDAIAHGTVTRKIGSSNGRARLSDMDIVKILKLISKEWTDTKIADKFNVSKGTILKIS